MEQKNNDKIKLFYYGDGPAADTGFGVVAKNILNGLYKTGKYDITGLGINYYGDPNDQGHLKIYPVQKDLRGRDRLLPLLYKEDPDVLFIINDYDAFTFIPEYLNKLKQETDKSIPVVAYLPVDGYPVYPEYVEFFKRFIDQPVLYTKYGLEQIQKTDENLELPYVYHGVDRNIFYPLSKKKVKEVKKRVGLEGKFVVGACGQNQVRKQFNLVLQAFSSFAEDKDDVVLYLHTMQHTKFGWNLARLVSLFGLNDKVMFTNGLNGPQGVPSDTLNEVYNLFDVHLSMQAGEGFGLQILESAATGAPTVYHEATAPKEWFGDAGFKVGTDHFYIFPFGDRELIRPIPSVGKAVEALNLLYENNTLRDEYSKKALDLSKKDCFKWDNAIKIFDEQIGEALRQEEDEELELEEIL